MGIVDNMTIAEDWHTLVIRWSMGWIGRYELDDGFQSDKMLPDLVKNGHVLTGTRKGYRNWQAGALNHWVEEIEMNGTKVHMVTVPEELKSKKPNKEKKEFKSKRCR